MLNSLKNFSLISDLTQQKDSSLHCDSLSNRLDAVQTALLFKDAFLNCPLITVDMLDRVISHALIICLEIRRDSSKV